MGQPIGALAKREENLPFFESLEGTLADGIRRTVRNFSGDYGVVFDNTISRVGDFVVVESRDVTATVSAERSQKLMESARRAVTDHMQELVILIDFQLGTATINEPCVDAFGDFEWLSEFIASGRPFDELQLQFPIDDPDGQLRAAFEIGVRVMQTGVPFEGVMDLPTLNGPRTFQVVASRWESEGEVRGLIDLKTDITDAVNARRASDMAREEIRDLSRVQNFAQGVAHDFGNVAQVIKGYAQLIQANSSPQVLEATAASLTSVADRSVRLAREIAEVARLGEVAAGPLRLDTLVHRHLPHLREAVGGSVFVTLASDSEVVVEANEAQIRSILDNLVENAARAMGGVGAIEVCIGVDGDQALLQVCDDGPGIPEDVRGRLFEPFSSGVASRASGGTGLGLYLMREYLESIGGRVEVVSDATGATFTISLPLARHPSPSPVVPLAPSRIRFRPSPFQAHETRIDAP